MASSSVSPVSGNTNLDPSQISSLNNNQITALLVSGNIDPKFVNLLMQQMSNNDVSSILFGSEDTSGDSSSTGFDVFGAAGLVPNNLPTSGSMSGSDVFGASSPTSASVAPQFQLSVYSQLIGKTVTVVNPLNQKRVTDKITSVQLQNQQVMLNVNGLVVPTSDLVSIQS